MNRTESPTEERDAVLPEKPRTGFWLGLSFAFAVLYGLVLLRQAFGAEYVVQDDARQHVFWMRRFLDPGLFPGDLIADYFQSVAPAGYFALYGGLAKLGVDPLVTSKLLPPLLLLIATFYCFRVSLQISPSPVAAFAATLLFNQMLATNDDLSSATPRAFADPFFLAFLDSALRGSILPCLAAGALLGLFYPPVLIIAIGVLFLRLLRWEGGRIAFSRSGRDYALAFLGFGTMLAVLLPFLLQTSGFEPVISPREAHGMEQFHPGGRSEFFSPNPLYFWVLGDRSGVLPLGFHSPLTWPAFLLPLLLRGRLRGAGRVPVTAEVRVLAQITLVSVALFFVAHGVLFRLHLPSRYTRHTLPIVMALGAGIVLAAAWERLRQNAREGGEGARRDRLKAGALAGALLLLPMPLLPFWDIRYETGKEPALYRFFESQPKGIRIASLSLEADNLPTFARRSVLASREYAIPYHMGYYREFQKRTADMIRAQYSPDPAVLRDVIRRYEIDFFVLDQDAFGPEYLEKSEYLPHFQPETGDALERLRRGEQPALARLAEDATVFRTERVVVLDTAGLRSSPD